MEHFDEKNTQDLESYAEELYILTASAILQGMAYSAFCIEALHNYIKCYQNKCIIWTKGKEDSTQMLAMLIIFNYPFNNGMRIHGFLL